MTKKVSYLRKENSSFLTRSNLQKEWGWWGVKLNKLQVYIPEELRFLKEINATGTIHIAMGFLKINHRTMKIKYTNTEREREGLSYYHISLMKHGQILEILGFAPRPNQLHRLPSSRLIRPRIFDHPHHLIQHLLRRHLPGHLLAVRTTCLEQIEAQPLARRALPLQLPLDGLDDLRAAELLAVDHGADPEVHPPVRLLKCSDVTSSTIFDFGVCVCRISVIFVLTIRGLRYAWHVPDVSLHFGGALIKSDLPHGILSLFNRFNS